MVHGHADRGAATKAQYSPNPGRADALLNRQITFPARVSSGRRGERGRGDERRFSRQSRRANQEHRSTSPMPAGLCSARTLEAKQHFFHLRRSAPSSPRDQTTFISSGRVQARGQSLPKRDRLFGPAHCWAGTRRCTAPGLPSPVSAVDKTVRVGHTCGHQQVTGAGSPN